jgi:hypothetical protein
MSCTSKKQTKTWHSRFAIWDAAFSHGAIVINLFMGAAVGLPCSCRSQSLLPDLIPFVREDQRFLVNWDIMSGRLRMQTMIANVGDGLLQIRTDNAGQGGPTTNVTQRVFRVVDNGPLFDDHTIATALNFHNQHGHIHLDDFSEFQLRAASVDANGVVDVGELVANTVKSSFRIHDSQRIPDPAYADASSYPSSNTGLYQNVSVGHGDVYSHGTEGQSISLSGVPVGPWYWLRQIVNPSGVIREKDASNNSFEILIDLAKPGTAIRNHDGSFVQPGDSVPPESVDLNRDGMVDILDWMAFVDGAQIDLSGLPAVEAYVAGDLNLDGRHGLDDFVAFRKEFLAQTGYTTEQAMDAYLAVPEPATLVIGIMGTVLLVLRADAAVMRRHFTYQ